MGPPVQAVRMKLVNWEEGNYRVTDSPNPRGEVYIGGGNIAAGYYNDNYNYNYKYNYNDNDNDNDYDYDYDNYNDTSLHRYYKQPEKTAEEFFTDRSGRRLVSPYCQNDVHCWSICVHFLSDGSKPGTSVRLTSMAW